MTPALPEIIWGGLAFLIVLAVLMKFAFPALKKGLKDREDKIRDDLERRRGPVKRPRPSRRSTARQSVTPAPRPTSIVEDARADAERIRREVVSRAEAEAADIRERAQEDIRLAPGAGDVGPPGAGRGSVDRVWPRRWSSATSTVTPRSR